MDRIEKVLFTAKAKTTGGWAGAGRRRQRFDSSFGMSTEHDVTVITRGGHA